MLKDTRRTLLLALATLAAMSASAQDVQLAELNRNIEIFSGVLEDALDFEEAKGLFGLSLGGIESTYLINQGVVLEVRTPLANSRNRLNLASLNSAMQSLQSRGNPFEAMLNSQAAAADAPRTMALRSQPDDSSNFYAEMMEKIASMDYSLMVNNAIAQANEAARSLRSLGSVDEDDYTQLRAELDSLRAEMRDKMQGLRGVEAEIRESAAAALADSELEQGLRSQLEAMMAQIEPLRERALAKAAELKRQSEAAERDYAARWQQDVLAFEDKLYQAMCDYGSTLRELPDSERVSIILTGLGELSEDQRRRDKIHVFGKADLQQCQSGAISVATLRERSSEYSY